MDVGVVYCNHHSADLSVRERLAFNDRDQIGRACESLRDSFPAAEHVVLSTCNRVEVYSAGEQHDLPGQDEVAAFLSDFHGVPVREFADELLEARGPDAVRHLFEVACSLDSMVLGEPQIVAQVKQAYDEALTRAACGPLTNTLFQMAFRVSARVRSETSLAEGRVSIASVAVGEFGRSIFSRFDDKRVVVIGAGEMAEETVRYLADEGAKDVTVLNRNAERGKALADRVGGTYRPFSALETYLAAADVVVSATGSAEPIVSYERFKKARDCSRHQMFVLDLGSPRDFDPRIAAVDDGVFLYDIDDLKSTCDRNRRRRHREVERARVIIEDESRKFMQQIYHRATGPVVARLRAQWDEIRRDEVKLLMSRLETTSPRDRAAIEKSIERIVNKLLHPPLEVLRDEARSGPPTTLVSALQRLFKISD